MPLAFNPSARLASVLQPLARSSSSTGLRSAARWAAFALRTWADAAFAASIWLCVCFPRSPPSTVPLRLAACSASFVRWEIISRSCSASAAITDSVKRFADGISTAQNSAPDSIICARNRRFRESRSIFEITSTALCTRHKRSAAASCGRSSFFPDSTSQNSCSIFPPTLATYCCTVSRCASSPNPDTPCLRVLTSDS